METALTGEIKGKVKNGSLKTATFNTLGGFYTEVYNNNTMYSACKQTMTGSMIDENKVPVPLDVRLPH
jgi:hypothetical protein